MANTNCLENVRCPKCGAENRFKIAASVIVTVTDDGTEDDGGDYHWEHSHYCECCECGYAATLGDFYIPNQGKEITP